VFKNRELRKIHRPNTVGVAEGWSKLDNEELLHKILGETSQED
jgi:hypothetical protein